MNRLHEIARSVDSREAFLEFVAALRADWEISHAAAWENPDLGRFLEAMQAWTQDAGDRVPEQPGWRTFAEMLLAARGYE